MKNYLIYMGWLTLFYIVPAIISDILSKVTDWDLDVIIFFAGCCFIEFTKGKKWDFK